MTSAATSNLSVTGAKKCPFRGTSIGLTGETVAASASIDVASKQFISFFFPFYITLVSMTQQKKKKYEISVGGEKQEPKVKQELHFDNCFLNQKEMSDICTLLRIDVGRWNKTCGRKKNISNN